MADEFEQFRARAFGYRATDANSDDVTYDNNYAIERPNRHQRRHDNDSARSESRDSCSSSFRQRHNMDNDSNEGNLLAYDIHEDNFVPAMKHCVS